LFILATSNDRASSPNAPLVSLASQLSADRGMSPSDMTHLTSGPPQQQRFVIRLNFRIKDNGTLYSTLKLMENDFKIYIYIYIYIYISQIKFVLLYCSLLKDKNTSKFSSAQVLFHVMARF